MSLIERLSWALYGALSANHEPVVTMWSDKFPISYPECSNLTTCLTFNKLPFYPEEYSIIGLSAGQLLLHCYFLSQPNSNTKRSWVDHIMQWNPSPPPQKLSLLSLLLTAQLASRDLSVQAGRARTGPTQTDVSWFDLLIYILASSSPKIARLLVIEFTIRSHAWAWLLS